MGKNLSPLRRAEIAVNKKRPHDALLKFEVSSKDVIKSSLSVSDLTEDGNEEHAVNILMNAVIENIRCTGFGDIRVIRKDPIVTVEDNFDNLLFPEDNAGRSSTYTRYVDEGHVLRTHTSAHVPVTFTEFYQEFNGDIPDTVFLFIGLVYRRDVIDPKHLDVFHQMDVWTLRKNGKRGRTGEEDLLRLIQVIFDAAVPGKKPIIYKAVHPYTTNGIEVYAKFGDIELEVLECGLSHPTVLKEAGFDPDIYSGLALGMGLDRLVMALKYLPDIRYLRSKEPRIVAQMHNTDTFIDVSNQPPISRDMSYCIPNDYHNEDICEEIKIAFGDDAYMIESVIIRSRTKYADLAPIAIERLGAVPCHDNVLVKITLRHPDMTLTKAQANQLYDKVYPKLHKGSRGYSSS